MTSVALKGLAKRKLRALLTALAIVLGVAMVSGTYVLTDTIKSAFDQIFAGSYQNTAAVITGKSTVSFAQSGSPTVPNAVLDRVKGLDGVQTATGQIFNLNDSSDQGKLIGRDGKPLGTSGNPTFAFGLDPGIGELNPMTITDGRWATSSKEIVIDSASAKSGHFAVGDRIGASVQGPIRHYRIVGIAKFGSVDSLGGATVAVFDTKTAQRLLGKDGYDLIAVSAKPGVSSAVARPRDQAGAAGEHRGPDGRGAGQGRGEGHHGVHEVHPVLPARVRGGRPVRGRVRHLQHALDHDRPADA